MAPTGRKSDFLGGHTDITERVRKLEVLNHVRTLVPQFWKPTRQELDAISGHMQLMGFFDDPPYDGGRTVVDAHVGPAAQYLWAKLDQQGFGDGFGVANEWTNYMMFFGAIPSPQTYDPINTGGGVMVVGDAAGGPGAKQRVMGVGGVPGRTTWSHLNAGLAMGTQGISPNFNGAGFYRCDGTQTIPEGAFVGNYGVDPILSTDATWGFYNDNPCGSPGPAYSPYAYPGIPVPYAAPPSPCPSEPPGTVFNGGHHYRVGLWLPTWVQLAFPPKPRYAALGGSRHALGITHGGSWGIPPGLIGIMDYLETYLSAFPTVSAWYANHMPAALAQQRVAHHVNHLSLRTGVGVFGRLEAQIRDQMAILRGSVAFSTDHLSEVGFLAVWPVRDDNAWQEDVHGYLLPETANGPGLRPQIIGHLNNGTPVPIILQPVLDGIRYLTIDNDWAFAYDAANMSDGTFEDFVLTIDGATIALEW